MGEEKDVAGKTIVVVGASSGFGRGAAERLGELGANVVVAARRGAVLDEVVAHIAAAGSAALAVETDVSDPLAVQRLADAAVERFGRIDVWVNNVGIGALGIFWDVPIADHARVIDVNVKGLMYGAHAALRQFRAQGEGTLINIGSVESEVPLAYQTSYAASKAAVLSMSRSLNEELRIVGESDRIKVGTIMPWAVDTPWWVHAANYTGRTPRMAALDDPQVVVDAIVSACVDPKEEQPVGGKARGTNLAHRLFPDLTERVSAKIAEAESARGTPVAHTTGAIYEPIVAGTTVSGTVRERMEREDEARHGREEDARHHRKSARH
ncbi:SDR family NAD(P)-dependent oxidoreductase [Microbacterium sp. 4R-513]|uniref:SDR family NAD(P)-dependent oxidoreductase n=1 Tax=Microbacterium sp. 4R-513 TaxID=2567934 RepID=UPI0013E18CC1|nr:SDR family NAD(P)-dependent oxidoreductase [Microbacterium sp. 4R-513]QIG38221.1 SDR family NAD(P)-dependent oxidoreductase [Microbacterium sp. 4R-513]